MRPSMPAILIFTGALIGMVPSLALAVLA